MEDTTRNELRDSLGGIGDGVPELPPLSTRDASRLAFPSPTRNGRRAYPSPRRLREDRQHALDLLATRFEKVRQLQVPTKGLHRLVDRKSRNICRDLEQHAAGLAGGSGP